ncbi:hypothetical protein DFR28_1214 [Arenicella xantha]|uniref:Uncharacterized protein n=2 Tax=Arenicella xantha TaxID=644221 RepID=A0A395JHH0_9GAMM|nr:hypothetical protein DFR28_1214 [Arenicella xantha]
MAFLLFFIAIIFYAIGWGVSALIFSLVGVLFEIAAWIALFTKANNGKLD